MGLRIRKMLNFTSFAIVLIVVSLGILHARMNKRQSMQEEQKRVTSTQIVAQEFDGVNEDALQLPGVDARCIASGVEVFLYNDSSRDIKLDLAHDRVNVEYEYGEEVVQIEKFLLPSKSILLSGERSDTVIVPISKQNKCKIVVSFEHVDKYGAYRSQTKAK